MPFRHGPCGLPRLTLCLQLRDHYQTVGVTGFEPATLASQTPRASQTAPHSVTLLPSANALQQEQTYHAALVCLSIPYVRQQHTDGRSAVDVLRRMSW
jgi:hypothetical protein